MSIIVVDDSSASRLMLCKLLKKIAPSKKIVPCPNGCLALAEISSGESVDLLVLDLGLPDISGYHILEVVRNLGHTFPIITLSDESNQSALKKSLELGARDYLTKPLSYQHLTQSLKAALPHELNLGSILVVDDEEIERNLCASLVEKIGFNALKASNGYEALRIIEKNHVSMIMMDLIMPHMDGLKACQKIRLQYPNIPIAMITSTDYQDFATDSISEYVDLFVSKPIKKRILRKSIQDLLLVETPTKPDKSYLSPPIEGETEPSSFSQEHLYKFAPAPLLQDSLEPGHHLDRGLKTIQESSVFFLNILNLPTIIKKMSSDECFRFMNSFFGTIHPVIQSFGGSLQRFSHDGLLAFFPLHKGQYSNNSIHAALSIQDTVTIYNRGRRRANYTAVEVDIGIATGPVAMGICGSELRFQEGAFGSTLLEATEAMKSCRALDENVVITKSTFQMLDQPETFNTRSVMDRSGILLPLHSVTAYSLKDTRPIQADPMNLMGEKQMRRMLEKNCGIVTAISHDIKNTLTSIKGIFDCLKDDSVPNMDIEELIDVGQSKLHLTGDYLQNLLNFVKKDRPKLNDEEDSNVRSSDLKKILQTVVHSHSFDATNAELKLKVEIPDEPFHFRIPRMDFIMAVSNLIGNAIKFTPPKGKITISIRKTSHLNRKQKVELTVKDNGRGIPKEHLSEIEKPYTQVYDEDAQLGMGLGLNNVRNVAQKHGGKLKVQSSLGKGSSFTVELHLEESGGPFERSTISPLRILLVDDDPVSLRVTQLALKNQGHNVTTCRNIPKALISYRTDDFDIIITDFDIRPEGNAFDLITVLNPQIPVICYSGEDEMPKNSLSKGIHGFIRKPASIELIQGAMQEAIQRQLHHQT